MAENDDRFRKSWSSPTKFSRYPTRNPSLVIPFRCGPFYTPHQLKRRPISQSRPQHSVPLTGLKLTSRAEMAYTMPSSVISVFSATRQGLPPLQQARFSEGATRALPPPFCKHRALGYPFFLNERRSLRTTRNYRYLDHGVTNIFSSDVVRLKPKRRGLLEPFLSYETRSSCSFFMTQ